ncbi:MAG TPA: hypothetical protein VLW85_09680 [Myxococcales bacterium]|nr:hypothetical protein [Myxococcales bacterium]
MKTIANEDWRLQGQDWLREEMLRFQPYRPAKAGSEHDHCEFCWQPFHSRPAPGAAIEGWVTSERRWICDGCYEDFKLMFDWVVET